ncbi:unnamed protein product [Acanthoscelides obtectus]|uniref:BTB domain-containing protein n=1 Tax=Acanthoscelides obtectus TaxID=200917 RepID=A0A9P0LS79_ACAOB|nr:unnamed protein product [Acanthoscelides obtectus]CAK1634023.1 Protein tramtrack, beta isoform [Acanthoscelides obtectus]
MTVQQYCLRWNNHQPNFISVFSSLLNSQSLVDVTLAAEGTHLQAHKVVLSACSSYFQSLFTVNPCKHPIVILKDVKFADLKVMVDFMYHGEVNVSQEQLPCILKTAEMLKIKGLTEIPVDQSTATRCQNKLPEKPEIPSQDEGIWSLEENNRPPSPSSPNSKRKRLKKNVICSPSGGTSSTDPTTDPSPGGSSDIILSTMDNVFGTVTKVEPDQRYSTDSTNTSTTSQQQSQKCNGVPIHTIQATAGPSTHDMQEHQVEQTHHISLQVTSHDLNTSHSVECPTMEIPRTTIAQQTPTGIQWNVLEHSGYANYSPSTTTIVSNTSGTQFTTHDTNNTMKQPQTPENTGMLSQEAQPQMQGEPYYHVHKRKRSINPQGDQNFMRALEAVRFGGIGFCKAARMYGVNNRTLWLEYKKRGYPNIRLSIKNRHRLQMQKQEAEAANQEHIEQTIKVEEPKALTCTISHPVALITGNVFDGNHMEFKRFST